MAEQQTINKVNGLDVEVLQETIGAIKNDAEMGKCRFRASNKWIDAGHNSTTVKDFYGAKQEIEHKQAFELHADEPPILAGGDDAANPVEYLLHALASCMTTSMVAHAAVRGIHLEEVESELEGDIDMRGFLGLADNVPRGYTNIRVRFKVKADADDLNELKKLAEFSPVLNTIRAETQVAVEVEPK